MSLLEMVRLAIARLGSSRLRATLTMLGVIIGVASVVALVAVGQGATSGITKQLQGLGTNLLTVNPGASTTGFTRGAAGSANTLTKADADAIRALPDVAGVEPELSTQGFVEAGAENTTTTVLGTTADYPLVRNFDIWQGAFLNDASVEAGLRDAVLGSTTADDLGLDASSIGSTITIDGLPFRVIGILQAKGTAGPLSNDDQVIVPITAVNHYFDNSENVRSIGISVTSGDEIDAVKAQVTNLLEQRHGIAPGGTDDFTISDQAQLLTTVDSVSGLLTVLLGGIASISLLVGGIGIMNIMLVSVRERTREIGVRMAIGARRRDILIQFLVEALTLSVIGGAIGVLLGVLVSAGIGQLAGWGFVFNPATVLVALVFSLLVGTVFGVWPARQAARLDPIAALRYE
jgi:putative ABC transport system permease protein